MPSKQWRSARRAVLKAVVLALVGGASVSCDEALDLPPRPGATVAIGSFRLVGDGMYEAFERWRLSLNEADRAVLEELIGREDLLIHVFRATGRLPPDESRGGASAPRSDRFIKQVCDFHPIVGRFPPERNWDVAYDPELAKKFEEDYQIPNPPEVVLHHEIFGHVIPALNDPTLINKIVKNPGLKKADECRVLPVENGYRSHIRLREVPPELIGCPLP